MTATITIVPGEVDDLLDALAPLVDAIRRRHDEEHQGAMWMCNDEICRQCDEVLL